MVCRILKGLLRCPNELINPKSADAHACMAFVPAWLRAMVGMCLSAGAYAGAISLHQR